MIINFRVHEIRRGPRKLTRTFTLIKKYIRIQKVLKLKELTDYFIDYSQDLCNYIDYRLISKIT
jgi:hypothetical protein